MERSLDRGRERNILTLSTLNVKLKHLPSVAHLTHHPFLHVMVRMVDKYFFLSLIFRKRKGIIDQYPKIVSPS